MWTTCAIVKSKTNEAVLAACAVNGANVFNGVRESAGQARTVHKEGDSWINPITTDTLMTIMVHNMGVSRAGNTLLKQTDKGALVYALHNFDTQPANP